MYTPTNAGCAPDRMTLRRSCASQAATGGEAISTRPVCYFISLVILHTKQTGGGMAVTSQAHGHSQVTPGCCDHQACGLQWRNSTVAEYAGWVWKSDTSSDETCGHFFAFAIAAQVRTSERRRVERKSYRVGPKVSSWPKILTVNPY